MLQQLDQDDRSPSSRLDRLDARVVPQLQRVARGTANRVGGLLSRIRRWEEGVVEGRPLAFAERHRRVLLFVVATMILVSSAVHLDRFEDLRDPLNGPRQPIREVGDAPGGGLAGGAQEVGPSVGELLDSYIGRRLDSLAALAPDDRVVAVVSFTSYVSPSEVGSLLRGLRIHEAQYRDLLVPDRPLATSVVDDLAASLTRAVGDLRGALEAELAEVVSYIQSGTVEDPEFLVDYQRRRDELGVLIEQLGDDPPLLFAVVVEGRAEQLRELADHDVVRLVDPAPGETSAAESVFFGLLPDDTDRASFGRRR